MSMFGPMGNAPARGIPRPPQGEPIAVFKSYLDAQRAVDFLSDNHFAVQFVSIVGSDLKMVERVTGRLTYARVAVTGAMNGMFMGLLVAIMLQIVDKVPFSSASAAMLLGAGIGMLLAIISYALTGGRRDFTSTSQIVASHYEVLCVAEHAAAARNVLSKLPQSGAAGSAGSAGSGGGVGYNAWAPPSPEQRDTSVPLDAPPRHPSEPSVPVSSGDGDGAGAPAAPASPVGPTYGEMIDRKRAEQRAREAAARAAAEGHPGT